MPKAATTAGVMALAVAAWLYNNIAAKKKITANRAGYSDTVEAEKSVISFVWPATNVLPSQATPNTQTQATIPLLKTEQPAISSTLILHITVINVPIVNMMPIMAASRPTITGLTIPTAGEMAEAYNTTAITPTKKIHTDFLAEAEISRCVAPCGAFTRPLAKRSL